MTLLLVAAVAVAVTGTVGRRAAVAAAVAAAASVAAAGSLRVGPAHSLSSLSIIVSAPKLVIKMTTLFGHLINYPRRRGGGGGGRSRWCRPTRAR